jgi:hypothetical protein
MKQVPGISYPCRRGAVYVFDRRVPKDLVGKPDITRPDKKPLGKFFKQSLDTPVLERAESPVFLGLFKKTISVARIAELNQACDKTSSRCKCLVPLSDACADESANLSH